MSSPGCLDPFRQLRVSQTAVEFVAHLLAEWQVRPQIEKKKARCQTERWEVCSRAAMHAYYFLIFYYIFRASCGGIGGVFAESSAGRPRQALFWLMTNKLLSNKLLPTNFASLLRLLLLHLLFSTFSQFLGLAPLVLPQFESQMIAIWAKKVRNCNENGRKFYVRK